MTGGGRRRCGHGNGTRRRNTARSACGGAAYRALLENKTGVVRWWEHDRAYAEAVERSGAAQGEQDGRQWLQRELALLQVSATVKEEAGDEMEERGVTGGRWGG